MFELIDATNQAAVIKVIGVGGGGGNAVQHMLGANIEGVDFICSNTDVQALKNSTAKTILQLGSNVTKGLGAGADPEIGRQAALEDRDRIMDVLDGAADHIGTIIAVPNFGAGDLLEIAPLQQVGGPGGKSWYLEFTRKNVPEVSFEKRSVKINPPSEVSERDAGSDDGGDEV